MTTILLAFLTALWGSQSPVAPTPEAQARAIVAALVAGDFANIESQYTDTMKQALPAGALATGWKGAATQLGTFESVASTQTQHIGTNQVVMVNCRFANADLTFRIVFDDSGRLAGFASLQPTPRVAWSPPDYADMTSFDERPVTVRTGRWDLPGFVTMPKSAGRHPAAVLVHGSGPNDADETIGGNKVFKDLADGLASRGVAVLRYEKRTHKYGAASADDTAKFTVKDEAIDDARSAVALLATMTDVDPARIFVAGHSEGAYLAPRIAAGHPEIAGIILLAGNVRPIEDLIVEQVRYEASMAGPVTPAIQKAIDDAEASAKAMRNPDLKLGMTVNVLGANLPASYVLDLRAYHQVEVAASLTIPILILQGERDYQVTMTDFGLWRQALGGKSTVTFKSYPALNHLFIAGTGPSRPAEYITAGHVDAGVVRDIVEWCKTR